MAISSRPSEFDLNKGTIIKICGENTFSIDIWSNDRPYRDVLEEKILNRIRAIVDERYPGVPTDLVDHSELVVVEDMMSTFRGSLIARLRLPAAP